MKYLGVVQNDKDIITKEFLDKTVQPFIKGAFLGSKDGILCQKEEHNIIIPIASTTLLGLVKQSQTSKEIQISLEGELNIGEVNINKVVQSQEDELILDCGSSTIKNGG